MTPMPHPMYASVAESHADGLADLDAQLDRLLHDGESALAAGNLHGAHETFRSAQRLDGNDPRVLSYLGYTLTLVARDEQKGVAFCEEAIRRGGEDSDALFRLACVYKATFQRQRAIRAVLRGLELDPAHPGHQQLLHTVGLRRPPVIGFLTRAHPLNILLGRIRH